MDDGGLNGFLFRLRWNRPRDILIIALLVREIFSFWTGHPFDMEVWVRNAYFVSRGQDPYAALMPPVPGLSFAYFQQALPSVGYLPPWSAILAGLYKLYSVLPGASRYYLYFLLKQPTILGDVAVVLLLYRVVMRWGGSEAKAIRAMQYWALFPYAIIISAIWGQFDSMVAVLMLMALLSVTEWRRYGLLGLGIALKWFPLLFIPYHFFQAKGWRRTAVAVTVLVPVAATVSIFAFSGWTYGGITQMSQSASHGGGAGMTYSNLLEAPAIVAVLGNVPYLYLALGLMWVPCAVLAGFLAARRFPGNEPREVVQAYLLVTAVFYLTRWGVYEQYLLYLLPLLLIDAYLWHPERGPLLRWVWLLSLAYLLVNNDFLIRFLGPVSGSFVDLAYAADNSPGIGLARTAAAYVLDILLTLTFVQLFLVFFNPRRDPRPWPRPFATWLRGHLVVRHEGVEPNP